MAGPVVGVGDAGGRAHAWGAEGEAIRADWLGTPAGAGVPIDDGPRSQPLLFAVAHGQGRLLLSWASPR
ncbi:hypothetical protein AB0D66_28990 [Streptomyces sp. NPDC048270]|uniref:hypothetical protein n=1 Tax=Streptomyces sp. NPDC048270 TaxID=3154615 RepID=UPI0033CF54A7